MSKTWKRIKRIIKNEILRIENLPSRENIWTAMEHSGWDTYEAYGHLLEMKHQGFIKKYSEVKRKNINKYKKTLVMTMLEGKRVKHVKRRLSEKAFLDWFFTDRQKQAIEQLEKGKLTNRVLSDFFMIDLPKSAGAEDRDISKIIRTVRSQAVSGTIFLWFEGKMPKLEAMKRNDPIYVVCSPRYAELVKEAGFSYVVKKNLSAHAFELSKIWHQNMNEKTVEITGTVGKTTTTEMIKKVVGDAFSMYAIKGNQNTACQVAGFVYNLRPKHDTFVQETAGSTPGQLERSSRVLMPDVFVLTNIGHGHIGNYGGSREFLLHEKLSIERHAAKDAVGVVNMDDELLRLSRYSHRIKWFSLNNTQADFHAENIREEKGKTLFTVVETGDITTDVVLNAIGLHNIYNALAAFAVGVLLEIDREKISKSLGSFVCGDVRQHFAEYGGRKWYFDCYSITEESVASHVRTLSSFELEKDGRRVLVLGDIIQPLGDNVAEVHQRVGEIIVANGGIDEVFMFGNDVQHSYNVVKNSNIKCKITDSLDTLKKWIKSETNQKDIVGFKANHFSRFEWVIDDLCGTDYYFIDDMTMNDPKVTIDGMTYKINTSYGAGLVSSAGIQSTVAVPKTINGIYVRLVGRSSFYGNKALEEITFPDELVGIEEKAFENCTNLKKVKFGNNLKFIGEKSFKGCCRLETIDLSKTQIGTIEKSAFAECKSLRRVMLPNNLKWIADDAFDGTVEFVE